MSVFGDHLACPVELRDIREIIVSQLESVLEAKDVPRVSARLAGQLLTIIVEETRRVTKGRRLRQPGDYSHSHEGSRESEHYRIGNRALHKEEGNIEYIRNELFGNPDPPYETIDDVPEEILKNDMIKRAAIDARDEWGINDEEYRNHILTGSPVKCPPVFTRVYEQNGELPIPPYTEINLKINTPRLKWRHMLAVCRNIYKEQRFWTDRNNEILNQVLERVGEKPSRGKIGDYFRQMAIEWESITGLPISEEAIRKKYERSDWYNKGSAMRAMSDRFRRRERSRTEEIEGSEQLGSDGII